MTDFDSISIPIVLFVAAILCLMLVGTFTSLNGMLETRLRTLPDNSTVSSAVGILENVDMNMDKTDNLFTALFIGMVIAIVLTGFFIGGHPVFAFFYFLFLIMGVVLAMVLRWAYENITARAYFQAVLPHLPAMNWIMTNLPYLIGMTGCIGIVAFFSRPHDSNQYSYG